MHKACSNVCLTQFWVFLLAHLTCVKRWLSALGLPDWLAQKIIACYVSASSKNYTIKMPSLEIFMCSPFLAGFVKWCYINNVLGKQLDAASIWRYRTVIGWAWWFNGYFFAMRYRVTCLLTHTARSYLPAPRWCHYLLILFILARMQFLNIRWHVY